MGRVGRSSTQTAARHYCLEGRWNLREKAGRAIGLRSILSSLEACLPHLAGARGGGAIPEPARDQLHATRSTRHTEILIPLFVCVCVPSAVCVWGAPRLSRGVEGPRCLWDARNEPLEAPSRHVCQRERPNSWPDDNESGASSRPQHMPKPFLLRTSAVSPSSPQPNDLVEDDSKGRSSQTANNDYDLPAGASLPVSGTVLAVHTGSPLTGPTLP